MFPGRVDLQGYSSFVRAPGFRLCEKRPGALAFQSAESLRILGPVISRQKIEIRQQGGPDAYGVFLVAVYMHLGHDFGRKRFSVAMKIRQLAAPDNPASTTHTLRQALRQAWFFENNAARAGHTLIAPPLRFDWRAFRELPRYSALSPPLLPCDLPKRYFWRTLVHRLAFT